MTDLKPKAREGLLTHDHSKRGRRYLSVLDPLHGRVTLLEPWEHAVLVLCDGTRTLRQIVEVLDHPIEGETVDLKAVQRALKLFEKQDLIEPIGLATMDGMVTPGPRTLAGMQQAYREWHKDPGKTGQILSGIFMLPFADPASAKLPVGLDPTVALPEDEEIMRPPVAIGTTLVVGEDDGEPDARGMKSLLGEDAPPPRPKPRKKEEEPATLVGSLAGGVEVAAEEFEEDELELGGKLSELLAAVDSDFAEVEKRELAAKSRKPPPLGKPIGGIAEVPRAKSLQKPAANVWLAEVEEKPATRVITDPDSVSGVLAKPRVPRAPTLPPGTDGDISVTDEPTMKSIPYSEAALRPTMVGLPPADGSDPLLIAAPRTSSKAGDWVGAVVAAEPTPMQRNVSGSRSPDSEGSDEIGAMIEDTLPYAEAIEIPTEGRVDTEDPRTNDSKNGRRTTTEPMVKVRREDEPTTNSSSEHIAPGRAREVFERLRKAGLKARSYSDDSLDRSGAEDHPARRKDDKAARRFEQALVSLTSGDLELALAHFRALFDQMPNSKRVRSFIEAIESVRGEQLFQPSILEDFEAALEDAIAYGRCPKCFSMMAPDEAECFACGFRLSRTI